MINEREFNDLCITCNHVQVCTVQKRQIRPVNFCEEFDDYIAGLQRNINRKEKEREPNIYHGICGNCASRAGCPLRKQQDRIMFCEEYE